MTSLFNALFNNDFIESFILLFKVRNNSNFIDNCDDSCYISNK